MASSRLTFALNKVVHLDHSTAVRIADGTNQHEHNHNQCTEEVEYTDDLVILPELNGELRGALVVVGTVCERRTD